jgi:transposase-like protein
MPDPMLYEVCSACGGTGTLKGPIRVVHEGVVTTHESYPCPACESRRVVATGVTAGQLERMVAQNQATKGGG